MECEYQSEEETDSFLSQALPSASKSKYEKAYDDFQKWNVVKGAIPITENVLLKYFRELAVRSRPTTLSVIYSMLKGTLRINDGIEISSYLELLNFIKTKNASYKPKKAKLFTKEEIEKFLTEAPDEYWLALKVVCIFSVYGAHSAKRLVNYKLEHVKQYDDMFLVTIPKTATSDKISYTITGIFFDIVQKYAALRPKHATENRFFLQYKDKKCTVQPIGINTFAGMPRRIAKYLKLRETDCYSALSFRINAVINIPEYIDGQRNINSIIEALPEALTSISSQGQYNNTYDQFQRWNMDHGATSVTEHVLLKYFMELAEKSKPTTLSATYSKLKATLQLNDKIDIASYSKLLRFVKRQNASYKPNKAKLFTKDEIEKFLTDAPDDDWLLVKVVSIFGVNGIVSGCKLVNIKVEHIKQYDDMFLVTIPKTATSETISFTLTGKYFDIVQKYATLRPKQTQTEYRFFLQFKRGKCTMQPIGRNTFSDMPRKIATYLQLAEAERYSGLSYRVNPTTILLNTIAWNAPTLADELTEGLVEENTNPCSEHSLMDYVRAQPRTTTADYYSPEMPDADNSSTDTGNEHVCTLSCGQVKCAIEGNESSVLHAFTSMKPPDYDIADVMPAQFASKPICRWIVTYRHISEPVSAFNADEAFEDITRSIPNNVRINEKYFTGNSSRHSAAYVVVYGVNCRCRKESGDTFNYTVKEIKCENLEEDKK